MTRRLRYLIAVSSVALVAACGGGDDPGTVAEVATERNLSALVAAADKAGLADELSDPAAEPTVFAPTDAAFNALATALGFADAATTVNTRDGPALAKIQSYHVLPARKPLAQLAAGNEDTLYEFEGSPATLTVDTASGARVTDEVSTQARVSRADVAASNGIVRVIDKVLVPPGVFDIVQMAKLNPAFSTLLAAVAAAGLDDDLSGTGAFTVFAPTNDAFTALLNRRGIDANALLALPSLADTLLYHVIPGNVRASNVLALSNPAFVDTLLDGADLEVRNDTLTLIDDDNGSPDATIAATDVIASNRVIHVITQVLLPAN